ncbi:MAG: hypothetical protein AAGA73_07240 [Pseudomonadota bacterium]
MLSGAFVVVGSVSASLWRLLGAGFGRLLKTDVQWKIAKKLLGFLLGLSTVPLWL